MILFNIRGKKLYSLKYACAFILLTVIFSCKKESDSEHENTIKQFHGKYSIVTAISDKEVDINLDGVENKNALKEVPELEGSYLELIVRGNTNEGVFAQFWQNQYFIGVVGKPMTYNPSIIVDYINQATVATFKVDYQNKSLVLSRSSDDLMFPLPISVEIGNNDMIKITHSKEIFTSSGWTTVTFEVVYKKFSSDV